MARKKGNSQDNVSYILPSTNEDLKTFVGKYKLDMLEQVVTSIEYAIKHKLPMVEIFQFKNSQFVITLSKKEFEDNLENIYNCYMDNEAYELCLRVVKLQKLLQREQNEKPKATQNSGSKRKSIT